MEIVRDDDDALCDVIGEWRESLCRTSHKAKDTSHAENEKSLLPEFRSCIS